MLRGTCTVPGLPKAPMELSKVWVKISAPVSQSVMVIVSW